MERVYFTSIPFEFNAFIQAIKSFTNVDQGRFGLSAKNWFVTLYGMFGLRNQNIYENGNAVFTECSTLYRDTFLTCMQSLYDEGAISPNDVHSDKQAGRCGWWNVTLDDLFGPYSLEKRLTEENKNVRLLITPPEIGSNGAQGVQGGYYDGRHIVKKKYYINADVTDDKLAILLRMFNDISYQQSTYMLAHFGIEGTHYTWSGEPFNSYVDISNEGSSAYVNVFATNTIDGIIGKHIYRLPDNAIYRYAVSEEATKMCHLPYKYDFNYVYGGEWDNLRHKYRSGDSIKTFLIMRDYEIDILTGKKRIETSWDDYIISLKNEGLDEWHDLINMWPET
jgi:hypothetical protein